MAVQVLDLGAPPLDHILEQARLAPAAGPRDRGDVGEQLGEPVARVGVEVTLGRNAVDRLDLVPDGTSASASAAGPTTNR
jgi:hypothetical protein